MADAVPPADEREPDAGQSAAWQRSKKAYSLVSDVFTPTRLLVLLGVLILLPLGLFGGFDAAVEAETEVVPLVEPSVAQAAAPFELELQILRYGQELKPIAVSTEGTRYYFLGLEVTNTSGVPVDPRFLRGAITIDAPGLATLPGSDTVAEPYIYRQLDALASGSLQPGLSVPVVLVWEADASAEVPAEVTVSVSGWTWREDASLGNKKWADPVIAYQVKLPPTPLKGS